MIPTPVFDTYWRFAAERHAMYMRRLNDPAGPWTNDSILSSYRFTNVYRVLDRVSQYLVRNVIYTGEVFEYKDILYRILLFKIFNKIETWEAIQKRFGRIAVGSPSFVELDAFLAELMGRGAKIYSAAYIMPSPNFGGDRKHSNHLRLLDDMLRSGSFERMRSANSLEAVYEILRAQRGIGKFLAFQYAIDVNYSEVVGFDEGDFVVAGPGALDGISKCFEDIGSRTPEEVIFKVCDDQEFHFSRLGLNFDGLFGRRMQPIDCQNVFCEISKYARVAHPEFAGVLGRTRIKQTYVGRRALQEAPILPPKWCVEVPSNFVMTNSSPKPDEQMNLFDNF